MKVGQKCSKVLRNNVCKVCSKETIKKVCKKCNKEYGKRACKQSSKELVDNVGRNIARNEVRNCE